MTLPGECVNATRTDCYECGSELIIEVCVSGVYFPGMNLCVPFLFALRTGQSATIHNGKRREVGVKNGLVAGIK